MKTGEAVKKIERFFCTLESFDLLSPEIRKAWTVILAEIAGKVVRDG